MLPGASAPASAALTDWASVPGVPPLSPASAPPAPGLARDCAEWARRLPSLQAPRCRASGLQALPVTSVQGRTLWHRELRPDPRDAGPRPRRVMVIGGIHGDEPSSTSLALHWLRLAEQTGNDIHWRFVPLLNPDGMLKARPTRTNARGVDLNRNFPTPRWSAEAPRYWEQRTRRDPRRWPGPSPVSEPESRWLHDEVLAWQPDLLVSVHAPYGVLDFDGAIVPPQRLGRLYLDQVGIFPGSLGHWGGVHKGVPVVTIELHSALRTPTAAEMRQMWLDLLRWIDARLPATVPAQTSSTPSGTPAR